MTTGQIALYAAIVATIALAWKIFEFLWNLISQRPRIAIQLSYEVGYDGPPKPVYENLYVKVVNHRKEPINVDSYGLMDSTGEKIHTETTFANERVLDGKDSRAYFINVLDIKEQYEQEERKDLLYAYVEDATGVTYKKQLLRAAMRAISS